jgi:hypothetical protein
MAGLLLLKLKRRVYKSFSIFSGFYRQQIHESEEEAIKAESEADAEGGGSSMPNRA